MSTQLAQLQEATIKQHCKVLRMPMMRIGQASCLRWCRRRRATPGSQSEWYSRGSGLRAATCTTPRWLPVSFMRQKGSIAHSFGCAAPI